MADTVEDPISFIDKFNAFLSHFEPTATILIPIIGGIFAAILLIWRAFNNKPTAAKSSTPLVPPVKPKSGAFISNLSESERYKYDPNHRAVLDSAKRQITRKHGAVTISGSLWFLLIACIIIIVASLLF